MKGFGKLLREIRKRAGLTQQALADKVRVDDSSISKMEGGEFLPVRKVAVGLADALGLKGKDAKNKFLLAAGVLSEEDVKGFELVEVGGDQKLRRRRSGALASDPIERQTPDSQRVEDTTVGQDIDDVLEGLSQEELKEFREILVPHTRQLVRLVKLNTGGGK
jgi:transcriptional regulator with XRE-family HTH domain